LKIQLKLLLVIKYLIVLVALVIIVVSQIQLIVTVRQVTGLMEIGILKSRGSYLVVLLMAATLMIQ